MWSLYIPRIRAQARIYRRPYYQNPISSTTFHVHLVRAHSIHSIRELGTAGTDRILIENQSDSTSDLIAAEFRPDFVRQRRDR